MDKATQDQATMERAATQQTADNDNGAQTMEEVERQPQDVGPPSDAARRQGGDRRRDQHLSSRSAVAFFNCCETSVRLVVKWVNQDEFKPWRRIEPPPRPCCSASWSPATTWASAGMAVSCRAIRRRLRANLGLIQSLVEEWRRAIAVLVKMLTTPHG